MANSTEYTSDSAEDSNVLMQQRAQRTLDLLESLTTSIKLVETNGLLHIRVEPFGSVWRKMSETEAFAICECYSRLNYAIRKGFVEVKPGLDSMRLVNLGDALDVLAPGIFDLGILESALAANPAPVAAIAGQWFPPGITIDLTPAETTKLLAILGMGGGMAGLIAALARFLGGVGIAGPLAGVIAAALAVMGAQIRLMAAFSKTGAVGFKVVAMCPPIPPVVIVYPI